MITTLLRSALYLGFGLGLALVCSLAAAQSNSAESISVRRAAALREAPGESARIVATLPAQSALTRLPERQGPWVQVRTVQGDVGWVHMFDLGSNSAGSGSTGVGGFATSALRNLGNLFNRGGAQTATYTPTATLGIRGLGAQDIANAQPNPAAVAQAESLRLDAAHAQQFGNDAALQVQAVEPLPAPTAGRAAPAQNQSNGG